VRGEGKNREEGCGFNEGAWTREGEARAVFLAGPLGRPSWAALFLIPFSFSFSVFFYCKAFGH
jgi:hypothetical protein